MIFPYPGCSAVSLRQLKNVRIQPIITTVLVVSSAQRAAQLASTRMSDVP